MRRLVITAAAVLALTARDADALCVIDSVVGLAFGDYDVMSNTPKDISGSVTYRCLISLSITIDISAGGGGTFANRRMARMGGGGNLAYNIYADITRTLVWGNGTSGTVRYGPLVGLLTGVTVPIYGRIPAKQDVATGTYTDTVVVTLNY